MSFVVLLGFHLSPHQLTILILFVGVGGGTVDYKGANVIRQLQPQHPVCPSSLCNWSQGHKKAVYQQCDSGGQWWLQRSWTWWQETRPEATGGQEATYCLRRSVLPKEDTKWLTADEQTAVCQRVRNDQGGQGVTRTGGKQKLLVGYCMSPSM